jgi:class 3 adenylate cyclase
MHCSNCGFDNPDGMKFCGECGHALQNLCAQCGFENPSRFKFCGACGTPLTGQTLTPSPPQEQPTPQAAISAPAPRSSGAERRQLTVMFCDLVDSTKLSSQLDPEDYREVVRAYQATCTEVIQRYEGHIAQLLGDGLLVYFGYPQAHEDDAQRAVRTGLGVLDSMGDLNKALQQTKGIQLAVRLGIHTGLVVVGEMGGAGRYENLALGEVLSVCSRIEGLAAPNTIAVSEATYHLVERASDTIWRFWP